MERLTERWERVVKDAQAGIFVVIVIGLSAFYPVTCAALVYGLLSLFWHPGGWEAPLWLLPTLAILFWLPVLGNAFKKLGLRM